MTYRNRPAIWAVVALALGGCSSATNTPEVLPADVASPARVAQADGVHHALSPTLYISDLIANTVTLYPANVPSPSPIATIRDGISNPKGIWVDKNGTLYVANSELPNSSIGNVTEYPAGASRPSLTIPSQGRPVSVTTDSKGNLYVGADTLNTGTDGVDLAPRLGRDAAGNLYVGLFADQINVYPPGSRNPLRSIGAAAPEYFTVTNDGALYTPNGDFVEEFLPGSPNPIEFAEGKAPTGAAIH